MTSVLPCPLSTADRRCRSACLRWRLLLCVLILCFLAGSLTVPPAQGQGLAGEFQPEQQLALGQQLAPKQWAVPDQGTAPEQGTAPRQGIMPKWRPELKSALLSGAPLSRAFPSRSSSLRASPPRALPPGAKRIPSENLSSGTHPAGTSDTTDAGASPKDPGAAVLRSLGGTVLLAPAYGAGLIIGPSFGHFYAANAQQAWRGIGLRAGAAAGSLLALSSVEFRSDDNETPFALVYLGLGVIAVSAIYDIADAAGSARQYNRARGLQAAGMRMRVAPTVGGPRGKQVGLALRAQF